MSRSPEPQRKLRVCLAASGGGHLRQLLDLESVWSAHDYFFMSEDTPLSRSLAEKHPMYFVPHVALGQAKFGRPLQMMVSLVRNFVAAGRVVLSKRPDVVISTGAGAAFFPVFWSRLLGAKTFVIESFARFDTLSAFARLSAPLAHRKIVQSKALAAHWPDAQVFDPLKLLDQPRPAKKNLMFVTVGTVMPFERMTGMVADLKRQGGISHDVLMQVGQRGEKPDGFECREDFAFDEVQSILKEADVVVCHGGTGSIITALRQGCRVIAVPRQHDLGEHYDDHQVEITQVFASRGLISVANTPEEFAEALTNVRTPAMATSDPSELIAYLSDAISELAPPRRAAPAGSPFKTALGERLPRFGNRWGQDLPPSSEP